MSFPTQTQIDAAFKVAMARHMDGYGDASSADLEESMTAILGDFTKDFVKALKQQVKKPPAQKSVSKRKKASK